MPPKPPPKNATPFRLPPHNFEAERAVLSACILKPEKIDTVAGVLRAKDFYHGPHAVIFRSLLELRAEGVPIDTVTLGHHIKDAGELAAIGGAAYLSKVVDETPSIDNVREHAMLVARDARKRRVIDECQRVQAEGFGEVGADWEFDAARRIADAAEIETRTRGAIYDAWEPLSMGLLEHDPEPRRWLLRHPTRDGEPCAPGQGDGFIPLEKAGILVSAGGAGKTFAMIQLALSVALGMPWLGHFCVPPEAAHGRVCLCLAEETKKDFHERIKPAADALSLTREQRLEASRRIVALPLFGEPVSLLAHADDGVTLTETEHFYALRSRLREHSTAHDPACPALRSRRARCLPSCVSGWSLVVLDPLARWAGDIEGDNAAATRFVQLVESLTRVPGNPTLLVVHHSSKDARKGGGVDSRGVTAITDGFRWQGTLRMVRGGAALGQAKSNYSIPMTEELMLKRGRGGVLRVQTKDEELDHAHRAEEAKTARAAARSEAEEQRIRDAQREILALLARSKVPITTRPQLLALVKGQQATKSAALTRLLHEGRITRGPDGFVVTSAGTVPANGEVQLGLL